MAAWSGQITVATAGTAVQGPDISGGAFMFTPHPGNSGTVVWVGNDGSGDVADDSGFPLKEGERSGFEASEPNASVNLSTFWFDADANGDVICWQRLR